jgi:CHAD domain-containing protein
VTAQPPVAAEAVRRLLTERHAAFARLVREATRSPTARRVHRSRVAARSLRALLAVLKPWLSPALRARARRDLRNMASEFGERREADVRRVWLGRLAASSGVLAPGAYRELVSRLERERQRSDVRLRKHLHSESCRSRLERIDATLRDPGLVAAEEIPGQLLRRRVRRRWKSLGRRLARHGTDPEALHALRIAAKKARYASETLSPLLGVDLTAPLQDLKALQDALGEHRDATEALEWLDRLGEPLGPILKARLVAPAERVRTKRLKQLGRLAGRFAVPDLAAPPAVSRGRRRGRLSPAGGAAARPAAGRRAASR